MTELGGCDAGVLAHPDDGGERSKARRHQRRVVGRVLVTDIAQRGDRGAEAQLEVPLVLLVREDARYTRPARGDAVTDDVSRCATAASEEASWCAAAGSDEAPLMMAAPPMRPARMPRSCASDKEGTFRLRTVPGEAAASGCTSGTASAAAVSHGGSPPDRKETARPFNPRWAPVSTAPTVPECRTDRPTLTPRLMPETTRSGGGPKAPSAATITASAGGASSP